jgi:hypothetical protein
MLPLWAYGTVGCLISAAFTTLSSQLCPTHHELPFKDSGDSWDRSPACVPLSLSHLPSLRILSNPTASVTHAGLGIFAFTLSAITSPHLPAAHPILVLLYLMLCIHPTVPSPTAHPPKRSHGICVACSTLRNSLPILTPRILEAHLASSTSFQEARGNS